MTVSANYAFDPTRDEIIRTALWRAGVLHGQQTATAEQKAIGSMFLHEHLNALVARGVVLNAIERHTQVLTAGTDHVTAPADTVTIERIATVRDTSGNDLSLDVVNCDEYQGITDKTTQGRPSVYYPEKGTAWTIYLWPVPTSVYVSITYVRTRKPRDLETGNLTLDIPPKFAKALTLALAADFSSHYKRESSSKRMAAMAEGEMNKALDTETPHGNCEFVAEPLIDGGF